MSEKISDPCFLYLVLPVYNEEEVLAENIQILEDYYRFLQEEGEIRRDSRILLVDDGSVDRSWEIISKAHQTCSTGKPFIDGIRFSRNEGHQTALFAGMEEAFHRGAEVVITMDADLQQDIHAIPRFLEAYREGADIVSGVRSSRKTDNVFKRTTASFYYKSMRLLGCDLIPNSADYRLLSNRVLDFLTRYEERDLFLRGIIPSLGFKAAIVKFDVSKRSKGDSKYTLCKMFRLGLNGITSFSMRPIRLVFFMGLLALLASGGMMIHILWDYLHGNTVSGWSSILASIWLLGGIGIFSIGLVGEYVGRTYMESKRRPRYYVEERLHKHDHGKNVED